MGAKEKLTVDQERCLHASCSQRIHRTPYTWGTEVTDTESDCRPPR